MAAGLAVSVLAGAVLGATQKPVPPSAPAYGYAEPGISPDGREIA